MAYDEVSEDDDWDLGPVSSWATHRRDEGVVSGDEAEAASGDLVDALRVEVCVQLERSVSGRGGGCVVLRRCALSAVYPGNLRACNAPGTESAVLLGVCGLRDAVLTNSYAKSVLSSCSTRALCESALGMAIML